MTTGELQEQNTLRERARLLAGGMRELTVEQLVHGVCALGYYLSAENSFNYYNTGNATSYKARAVAIYHAKSGKSFANLASPKERLPELQSIRGGCFVFHAGRIWEF